MCAALFQCQAFFLNSGSIYAQCVSVPFPINWNQAELVLAAESCRLFGPENRTTDQKRRKRVPKRTGLLMGNLAEGQLSIQPQNATWTNFRFHGIIHDRRFVGISIKGTPFRGKIFTSIVLLGFKMKHLLVALLPFINKQVHAPIDAGEVKTWLWFCLQQ